MRRAGKERLTDMRTFAGRQTDRQTDRQTKGDRQRETDRQAETKIHCHTHTKSGRETAGSRY